MTSASRRNWLRGLFAGLLLLAYSAGTGLAQGESARFYTLSQERLFNLSEFGTRVRQEIETASLRIAAENQQIAQELRDEELALTEQRATLNPAEFRVLADAFDEKVELIRRAQAEKSQALGALPESEQQRFFESAFPILVTLAEELNALAILDERSTIIASDRIDITSLAIDRVNAAIGDGTTPNE